MKKQEEIRRKRNTEINIKSFRHRNFNTEHRSVQETQKKKLNKK